MRKALSVYIHIPFCERRCGYCDFYSTTDMGKIDEYVARLCAEIEGTQSDKHLVKTVYVGGGTPSVLTPAQITAVFDALYRHWKIAENAEITIECNPNSMTADKLAAYRRAGVNRISIGVQSFDDRILRQLGRIHDRKTAIAKIKLAKQYFDNISIDLIVGVPNEKKYKIPKSVLDIIAHISIYSLMKDDSVVCEDAIKFDLPDFERYEVSNYARGNKRSRHNMVYWNGGEYLGFGAAAHSLMNNRRFNNTNDLEYVRENEYERTPNQIKTERVMLGLRTAEGIPFEWVDTDKFDELNALQRQGLIQYFYKRIIATDRGWELLNQITLSLTNQTR